MFTVCPKCALTLVVTAADLRVAQGYVRCGRCSSVFNALARLTDERSPASESEAHTVPPPSDTAAPPPRGATGPPSAAEHAPQPEGAPADDDEAIPDAALEFDPTKSDVSELFVDPPPNPQWTAATGSFKAMIAAQQEETEEAPPEPRVDVEIDASFLASMLRTEASESQAASAHPAESSPAVAPPAEAAPATPTSPSPSPHALRPRAVEAVPPPSSARPVVRRAEPHTRTRPGSRAKASRPPAPAAVTRATPPAQAAVSAAAGVAAEESPWPFEAPPAHRAGGARGLAHLFGIGTAVGTLVLLAQIVNHYRDDLAASPRFNRPLTRLYAALGVHLAPRWDLHAYDVRQLGASVEPGGAGLITLRASIKNSAPHPQPLPLLRVTLEDRFGNRIASSDVAPRFYLPSAVPASSFLSGGQRIDAEMGFVDPGANAVGFEIDACLPASSGGVTCANDVSAR